MTAAREPIGKPKPRRGRPPLLTPELQAEWVRLVVGGLTVIEAARELKIPDRTRRAWLARGRGDGRTAGAKTPALGALFGALSATEVSDEVIAWSRVLADNPWKFLRMRDQDLSKQADRELTRELAALRSSKRAARAASMPSDDQASGPPIVAQESSGRGRPLSLTPQIAAKLVLYVLAGAPPIAAARALHIPERTFRSWRARGRGDGGTAGAPTPALEELDRALTAAEAKTFVVAWARLHESNPGRWLRMRDLDQAKLAERAHRRELARIRARRLKADPPAQTGLPVQPIYAHGMATAQEARQVLEILRDEGVFDDRVGGPAGRRSIRILPGLDSVG